jgi:hypothetical protein
MIGFGAGSMSVRVWHFLRPQPGELRPVPRTCVEAFVLRGGRLSPDGEGFVRFVQVIVRLEQRRAAVEVLQVDGFQYRATGDGRLDKGHFQEIAALVAQAAFGGLTIEKPAPGLIGAEHRFAKRRLHHEHRWQLTDREVKVLRALVNQRARSEIW